MRQVMGQGGGRHADPLGHLPRRQTAGTFAHQQPENRQPVFLRQRPQCLNHSLHFHISTLIEVFLDVNVMLYTSHMIESCLSLQCQTDTFVPRH